MRTGLLTLTANLRLTAQGQIENTLNALKKRWCLLLFLCICCPLISPFLAMWYGVTSCVRPRCYLSFTTWCQICWIWMDEVTDAVVIYFLLQNGFGIDGHQHRTDYILHLYVGCIALNHFFNVILSTLIRNNWCFDKRVLNRYHYLHHQVMLKLHTLGAMVSCS